MASNLNMGVPLPTEPISAYQPTTGQPQSVMSASSLPELGGEGIPRVGVGSGEYDHLPAENGVGNQPTTGQPQTVMATSSLPTIGSGQMINSVPEMGAKGLPHVGVGNKEFDPIPILNGVSSLSLPTVGPGQMINSSPGSGSLVNHTADELQSLERKEESKFGVELETFSCSKCSFVAKSKAALTRHINKTEHHDNKTVENGKNNKRKLPVKPIKVQATTIPQKKESPVKTNVDLVDDFKQDIFCEFLKERRVVQQSIKLKDVFLEWMVDTYPNIELDIDINDDFMKKLELSDRIEGIIGPSGRYCWVSKSEHSSIDEDEDLNTPDPNDIETANEILKKCGSENLIFGMKDALTALLLRHSNISAQRMFNELLGCFPAYKPNSNLMVMRMLYVLNQDNDFVKDEGRNVWGRKENGVFVGADHEVIPVQPNKKQKIEHYDPCVNDEDKDDCMQLENGSDAVKVEN